MEQCARSPEAALAELCLALDHDLAGAAQRWAECGAMALTGEADGPTRQAPASVTSRLDLAAELLARYGGPRLDGPALLGERAVIAGFTRGGDVSVGGQARLLRAADGPVCLNLPRADDLAALPAWLEADFDPSDWGEVIREIGRRPGSELATRADLLGLPVGVPGTAEHLFPASLVAGGVSDPRSEVPLVVEFGSLWAAPLSASLLQESGCRVVKVESTQRPDGARRGPRPFFDLLNAGKEAVALDPYSSDGRHLVRRLVERADVVIEASRPRALRQWGLDMSSAVEDGTVWVSITGYGRKGRRSGGVAFGDDAAVSGGLILSEPLGFVGDAVADPAAGLVSAVLALAALSSRTGWLVDVSLAGVAAWLAENTQIPTHPPGVTVEPPRARTAAGRAAELGADTAMVIASLGP